MKKLFKTRKLAIVALVFYIVAAVMLFKGINKMTRYRMSENYPSINVNAYVGGDAYNYIINGTYATAFFVLSMGFTVTGTIFLIAGMSAKPDSADTLEASDDAPIVLPDPDVQAAAAAPESQPAPDNDYPVQ